MKSTERNPQARMSLALLLFVPLFALAIAADVSVVMAAQNDARPSRRGLVSTCSAPVVLCPTTGIFGPCRIIAPGSYKLTASVDQTDGRTDGIAIAASHVTLDLNGFRVDGPSSASCVGINACQGPACGSDITVKNGTVTSFGGAGIQLGPQAIVQQIHAYNNGEGPNGGGGIAIIDQDENGTATHASSVITDNIANCNGHESGSASPCEGNGTGDGIACGTNCVISGNVANANAGNGIAAGNYDNVTNNVAAGNGGVGISGGTGAVAGRNVMDGNSVKDLVGGTAVCGDICSGTACSSACK